MLISYVIVGFHSGKFVPGCLRSIIDDAPSESEIVFIDNASADDTAAIIRRDFPDVKLIVNERNIGHCGATNQGFKVATGRYIALLDADTELQPGTTRTILDFFASHTDVDLVAPRMVSGDGTVQETARRFPTLINAFFGRQTLLARAFPGNPFTARYLARENLNNDAPFAVEWVSAACMVFPRRVLDRVGYWDEGFAGYWVDCDWCKSIQEAGGSIYCVPSAKVWHLEQNRPRRKKSIHRIVLFNRGALRYYTKHHTSGRWDPRAVAAALFVAVRTLAQLAANVWARPDRVDEISQGRPRASAIPSEISIVGRVANGDGSEARGA